jgi:hypothetical protein
MRPLRRLLPLLLLTGLLVEPVASARAADVVRNPGDPSYVVSLRGGRLGHAWRGSERISFTNLEADPLGTIWLRLWSNGVMGCGHQAIVVSAFLGGSPGALSRNCTALPVTLDAPLAEGQRTTISMHVSIDLPRRNDRFGYHRGLALLGTALPTLAIHDDLGWHLDPFVDLGESFYSIVGDYEVTLSVPEALDTPTSGVAVSSQSQGLRRTTTYEAENVRDFEWAAGHLAEVRARSGKTQVVVSYRPQVVSPAQARIALGYAVLSLDTYSTAFRTFPYPEMDVVLTGFTAFGGMEYPTIIFTNSGKITIAHEMAHQYFYGLVGDDQYHAPWLDESFATWVSYLPFGGWKKCPFYRWPSDSARITNDMGYWATHQGEYDTIYGGGGCLLANLASRFGLGRFVRVLRDYVQAHWLGVTRTEDFTAAIDAAALADALDFDPTTYWMHWRVD